VRSLYVFHGLVNNHVYTIATRGAETVAGTLGGLSVLDEDTVRVNYTTANSRLKQNWITALARVGDEWLAGTYGAGVLRLDASGEWHSFPDLKPDFVVNPNATAPANIVLTWAQEQPFLVGSTSAPSSISGVTLSGTPAAPTVTVTGSNFGTAAPTATPETCQEGDTGNDYGFGGLELQDVTESWGAGEAGDLAHGLDLGRAGDRASREGPRKQVQRPVARLEPAGHRRHQVMDVGVGLNRTERLDLDRARPAGARQVVAHQVHDHQVLGPVLDAGEQLLGQTAILRRRGAARARALDRPALGLALRGDLDEPFGRVGYDRPAR